MGPRMGLEATLVQARPQHGGRSGLCCPGSGVAQDNLEGMGQGEAAQGPGPGGGRVGPTEGRGL